MNYEAIVSALARGFTQSRDEREDVRRFMRQSCGYCQRSKHADFCVRHSLPTALDYMIGNIWRSHGMERVAMPSLLETIRRIDSPIY